MSNETILIVEDDPTMMRGLKDNFEFAGYSVVIATTGEKALDTALNIKPDLMLLDIMLPGMNGYEICRLLRDENLKMPIIMLTAKNQESDIVLGLNLGADDYVTKPFSIKELMARANAFIRSRKKQEEQVYSFGPYNLDIVSRKLMRNEIEIELTPKEFDLLSLFVKTPEKAMTREYILNTVWGYNIIVTFRSVDRCINSLRNKIEADSRHPKYIKTIREIGYRFDNSHNE